MRAPHPPGPAGHLPVQHPAAHDVRTVGPHPRRDVELEHGQLRVETQPSDRPTHHGLHPLERSEQGLGPRQRVPSRLRGVRGERRGSRRSRRRAKKRRDERDAAVAARELVQGVAASETHVGGTAVAVEHVPADAAVKVAGIDDKRKTQKRKTLANEPVPSTHSLTPRRCDGRSTG